MSGHVQSVLASVPPRSLWVRWRARPLERASRHVILDCGDGVRLAGRASAPAGAPRGLAVLLHGWEGSARSTYVLSLGRALDRAGWAVFRLNLRDHGRTQALNEGVFHSCRLDEVLGAVGAIARSIPGRPLVAVGFSLGGNFALRLALHAPRRGITLDRVIAVSPAIDPANVYTAIEDAPRFYEAYFERRWQRSMRIKQTAFPERYDFAPWLRLRGLRAKTRWLIERHSEMADLVAYFDGFSVAGARLAGLEVPATVITAADDPLVPVADARALAAGPSLALRILERGGHVGFLDLPRLSSAVDRTILEGLATTAVAGRFSRAPLRA